MLGRWGSKVRDRWILCAIGALCLALLVLQSLGIENKPDFERSLDAVIVVKDKNYMVGTGFFFSPEGCALTADHVIKKIKEEDLYVNIHPSLKKFKAKVIYRLPYLDAAIVCMDGIRIAPAWLTLRSSENMRPGDTLYLIGHSSGNGQTLKWAIKDGILSKQAYLKRARINEHPMRITMKVREGAITLSMPGLFWFQQYTMFMNVDILPGDSGGPVLDEDGYAVGMAIGWSTLGPSHSIGISRAIPGTDLLRMIRDAREK